MRRFERRRGELACKRTALRPSRTDMRDKPGSQDGRETAVTQSSVGNLLPVVDKRVAVGLSLRGHASLIDRHRFAV